MRENRRAQFLEIDIILSIVLLIAGVLLLKPVFIHSFETPQVDRYADDSLLMISAQTLRTLDPLFISNLALSASPLEVDLNETIARQILIFIINDREDLASSLAQEALGAVIPEGYGYNVSIISNLQRYPVYSSFKPVDHSVSQSRTLLTGLEVGSPVTGYTGSVFLSTPRINRSSYVFFGGFVGQGNISSKLFIPEDAVMNQIYIEGDFHDDFDLYVNGVKCAEVIVPEFPDPFSNITMVSLDDCVDDLIVGENDLLMDFKNDDLDSQYVGGGMVRASYFSSSPQIPRNTIRQYLPGISGIFNLYDGMFIPGVLRNMNVHLHYIANHSEQAGNILFMIGNKTLLSDNTSVDEQVVDMNNSYMSSNMNYSELTNQTVPVRFGYDNASIEIGGGVASVSLITDVSWSMIGDFDVGEDPSMLECDELDEIAPPATRVQRLLLAKCVDKFFSRMILNGSGSRLGLVSYGPVTMDKRLPDSNLSEIISEIDDYDFPRNPVSGTPLYGTCTACSVKSATDQLKDLPTNIPKAMIIMSDGGTNACYKGFDADGYIEPDPGCVDPQTQTVEFAKTAHYDYNITIYTVAFGNAARVTLQEVADETEGYYFEGNDAEELRQIYAEIADSILSSAYSSQVFVALENSTTLVFPDSYIDFSYSPYVSEINQGTIMIEGELNPFSQPDACVAQGVSFPLVIKPLRGSIISYSGEHWTDLLEVNGRVLYDLSRYGSDYKVLGDPFVLGIPEGLLTPGPNEFTLSTGDGPDNSTGCSPFNRLIYTAELNSTVTLDDVFEFADGCSWYVEFPDGFDTVNIPSDYNGTNVCQYSSTIPSSANYASYNNTDAWQVIGFKLFHQYDFDPWDGVVDIDFSSFDLTANLEDSERIPYMWGPAILEVVVWQ